MRPDVTQIDGVELRRKIYALGTNIKRFAQYSGIDEDAVHRACMSEPIRIKTLERINKSLSQIDHEKDMCLSDIVTYPSMKIPALCVNGLELQRLIQAADMTICEFADLTNLSSTTIYRAISGKPLLSRTSDKIYQGLRSLINIHNIIGG